MTKGQRIKQLREQNNLTQSELATKLNTTKQTISKYEKDIVTNIPSDRIEMLASVLGSTPEYILGWKEVQKKNDNIADIIVKLREDEDFLIIVEKIKSFDRDRLLSLLTLLK